MIVRAASADALVHVLAVRARSRPARRSGFSASPRERQRASGCADRVANDSRGWRLHSPCIRRVASERNGRHLRGRCCRRSTQALLRRRRIRRWRVRRRRAGVEQAEIQLAREHDDSRERPHQAQAEQQGALPDASAKREPKPRVQRWQHEDERVGLDDRQRHSQAAEPNESGRKTGEPLVLARRRPRNQAPASGEPAEPECDQENRETGSRSVHDQRGIWGERKRQPVGNTSVSAPIQTSTPPYSQNRSLVLSPRNAGASGRRRRRQRTKRSKTPSANGTTQRTSASRTAACARSLRKRLSGVRTGLQRWRRASPRVPRSHDPAARGARRRAARLGPRPGPAGRSAPRS